ncbi:MAG: hypothetical protein NUV49_02490 [Patescibacteria group bacterium]|nr:hypothetical protein [Patescibacteria group bacterium]
MIDPEVRQAWKRIKAALPQERGEDIRTIEIYALASAIDLEAHHKSMSTDQTTQEEGYSAWIKLKRRVRKYVKGRK